MEDSIGIGQMCNGGESDRLRLLRKGLIARVSGKRCESTQNDALVVAPGGLPIVLARRIQSVVDEVLRVDHAGRGEPGPFFFCPSEVAGLLRTGSSRREVGGYGKEEFVGNGVLILPVFVPPNASAADAVPSGRHVREDSLRHVQILDIGSLVIGGNPGERPPALIVVIFVEEAAGAIDVERVGNRSEIFG